MRIILFTLLSLFLISCSKPKTVLICGDHICINKDEAEQYFQDNLTLEVKIIDKKKPNENNLVELNLSTNKKGNKEISISNKENNKKKIKILSDNEIKKKKALLKKIKKEKNKNYAQIKKVKENKKKVVLKRNIKEKKESIEKKIEKKTSDDDRNKKNTKDIKNICVIIDNCDIDTISKYLINQGKEKDYPNISIRE
tara:strand:+ start:2210 stop:2800 length:591 start_codon:yes stop_codon:yes gene_type:complete